MAKKNERNIDTKDVLQSIRDAGNWVPANANDIRDMVEIFKTKGEEFPECIARLDFIFWLDKGDIKPYRYYAARWRWSYSKTRRFIQSMCEVEVKSERITSESATNHERITNESKSGDSKRGKRKRESAANHERITNESTANQYHQTSDFRLSDSQSELIKTHAREGAPDYVLFPDGKQVITPEGIQRLTDRHAELFNWAGDTRLVLAEWILSHERAPKEYEADVLRELIEIHGVELVVAALGILGERWEFGIESLLNIIHEMARQNYEGDRVEPACMLAN